MASLANSEGWMEKPATWIHRREPLICVPTAMVTTSSARPRAPMR